MITVVAQHFIETDHVEEARQIFKRLVEEGRREPGCISYQLHAEIGDPTHFVLIERWEDKPALDRHMVSAWFRELVPQLRSFAAKPVEACLLEEL